MHQHKLVWRKLKEAGILDSEDPRLQALVQYLHENRRQCWPDLISAFRENFYDCFDAIVPKLMEIKDPLIQLTLVKHADPEKPKEKAILEKLAAELRPDRDQLTVKRLAKKNIAKVNKTLRKRSIPEHLRALIESDEDDSDR